MDVRGASLKVKEYFREVKGIDPLAFDIERATFDEEKKVWIIECSFYRNPLEAKRLQFKLLVDDETGTIKELTANGKNGGVY